MLNTVRVHAATVVLAFACALSGCSNNSGPTDHEMACAGGTFTGAVLGGFVGNQFGKGKGNKVLTGAGVATGAALGARAAC